MPCLFQVLTTGQSEFKILLPSPTHSRCISRFGWHKANCIAYAVGERRLKKAYPGKLAQKIFLYPLPSEFTAENIAHGFRSDQLIQIRKHEVDLARHHVFAALLNEKNPDVHAVRFHTNGICSHYNGLHGVQTVDFSGNAICDPEQADLGDYKTLVGYFMLPQSGIPFYPR